MRRLILLALVATASAVADTPSRSLDLASPAFANNGTIPTEYTSEGADVSPPLLWSKVPAGTKSIAILVDDPDAPKGTFTHWLVTGIPATTRSLGKGAALPPGATAAKNDTGTPAYAGPCPPSGKHRYQFRVYALDVTLPKAMTRADFLNAISGHILASGQLVGMYQKQAG
jgi:Raf kinase inhibitor-like YbhB/YbcL family protein